MATTKAVPWLRLCAIRPVRPRTSLIRTTYNPPTTTTITRHSTTGPDKLPTAPKSDQIGPNMAQEDHVSEEAAKMAKIQGKEGPDMEAGTPVQEIMAEDKDFAKDAPKVLKEDMKNGNNHVPQPSTEPAVTGSAAPGGKRSFSTSARQRRPELQSTSSAEPPLDPSMLPSSNPTIPTQTSTTTTSGLKFPLPTAKIVAKDSRHPAILTQFTALLMRDGKKSVAEKHTAAILNHLRTASPPTYSPKRPLLPGAPPASYLPLNPIAYLTLAIDSVAPLLRIRSLRGAAGGGAALPVPVPLALKQRRRQAMTWIIDAAGKKGNTTQSLAQRVAGEIVAVVEGRSAVWEKRGAVHKLGTTARSNLKFQRRR